LIAKSTETEENNFDADLKGIKLEKSGGMLHKRGKEKVAGTGSVVKEREGSIPLS